MEHTMDIRTPDNYKSERLYDTWEDVGSPWKNFEPPQDSNEATELEKAMLLSLEESWRVNRDASHKWKSFQPLLKKIKRIGMFDPEIQQVFDLLSMILYQYSYEVSEPMTEECYLFIEKNIKPIRISEEERDNLKRVMDHLRSGL